MIHSNNLVQLDMKDQCTVKKEQAREIPHEYRLSFHPSIEEVKPASNIPANNLLNILFPN